MAFTRRRGVRALLWTAATLGCLTLVGGLWIVQGLLSDLPSLKSIDDYSPPVTSRVLDRNGRIIGEFYIERRNLVPMEEIPQHTRMAFVSAEDGNFFRHGGIDFVSIGRAAWVDLTEGRIKQGGSTITMQLVKQLLLSTERTFERKFREMVLARELEKSFTKNEILWLYLNQIYFGQGAWGIDEAAITYFDKPARNLTLSESALLAGLPQRPSQYSPVRNPGLAEKRRRYVLNRMLQDEVISAAEYAAALADIPILAKASHRKDLGAAAYFAEEVRRDLYERLGSEAVLQGGLRIETTLDMELQKSAVKALREGLEAHDRRQGYRGPLRQVEAPEIQDEIKRLGIENGLQPEPQEGLEQAARQVPGGVPLLGIVVDLDSEKNRARIALGPGIEAEAAIADVQWAREPNPKRLPYSLRKITSVFAVGDVTHFEVIEGEDSRIATAQSQANAESPLLPRVRLFQRPQVQGALFSLEVSTGDVLAMVGGYDYRGSEFNRVTQAQRQPGSAFKPFIYGAAIAQDYSPVSTLWDRPVVYEDPVSGFVWRPKNYGREFYGPVPMRYALVKSINNATVHLFRDVGVDYVIDFSRRLGIQAPFRRDLSLALGSSGTSLLEIVTAYAVFPNHGRRVAPHYIRKVTNRDGEVLLENLPMGTPPPPVYETLVATPDDISSDREEDNVPEDERVPTDQLITEQAAFLMCDMLKGVVVDPDGTGKRLRELRRPVAGKTGTTNDQADAWFVGFSPDIATGVWVGHDEKLVLGRGETGSRAASPIWVDYMRDAMKKRPRRDFEVPEGIVFQRIDRKTGLLAEASSRNSYFQPFLENTGPTTAQSAASTATDTRRALRGDSF